MNILILKSYGIGNVLMMTPMIRELDKAGHNVYVLYDAGPLGGPAEELIGALPQVKGMKPFDRTNETCGDEIVGWVSGLNLDLCVQSWPGDSQFGWLYPYLKCPIKKADKISNPTMHESEYNLEMVRDIIGPEEEWDLEYQIPPVKDLEGNLKYRIGEKPYVVLCPSFKKEGDWAKKNWGIKNYAQLAAYLIDDGYNVVLVDGPDGIGICNAIAFLTPDVINLGGQTSIAETFSILKGSFCVVANDSGPAHMASAVDAKLVVFFGPTSPIKNQPIGENTMVLKTNNPGVYTDRGDWNGCSSITIIRPEVVMRIIKEQLHG